MEMVWKDHKKVSIGYYEKPNEKSYVVYWFCGASTRTDFKAHRRVDGTKSLPNKVGKACMVLSGDAGDA